MHPPSSCMYKKALGATELWNLGGVAGLQVPGAAFFVGEPANNGWKVLQSLALLQQG